MKAINWSSRTVHNQQLFESPSMIRLFISLTHENSGKLNLFLQMGLIISSIFTLYDFLSLHPQQQIQIFQFLCFIDLIVFLALAAAVSDMVGFSLLIH